MGFVFALQGDGSNTLELDIYSEIGPDSFWCDTISAKDVRRLLRNNPQASLIKLRVNSSGGDAFEAQAIYADLQNHPARVEAEVSGLAASCATMILMAADRIAMAEGAWFMIHDPYGCACGSPEELEAWADVLRRFADSYADTYAKRSGLDRAKVVEMMSAETWLTATEAKAAGFVDEVVAAASKPAAKAARAGLRDIGIALASCHYGNLPAALTKHVAAARARGATVPPKPPEHPAAPPVSAQISLPIPEPVPAPPKESTMSEQQHTSAAAIARALGLPLGASDSDALAAAARLREMEVQLCAIAGVQTTAELVGAFRGIKAKADLTDGVQRELVTVKGQRDKQEFEGLLAKGKAQPVKLSPASARFYEERFAAASAEGRGADVVTELRSFLEIAPTILPAVQASREPNRAPSSTEQLAWNGKAYAELTPMQRHTLWQQDPELWALMKKDFDASNPL